MSEPYIGEIRLFGFSRAPVGWLACDGSLVPISGYEALYTLIGTTYGGDGITTFATPDLGSRVPVHYGSGQDLTPRPIGAVGGTETVTLVPLQLPEHRHPMIATTNQANSGKINPTAEFGAIKDNNMYASDVTGVASVRTSPSSTSSVGGNAAHDNLMPTLTVQFCIAHDGIFPSRD